MPSKSISRRINIFLNGKAVAGTVRDMRKEWRKLNNEITDLTPGTKEYIKTAKRMKELDGLMKEHRGNIRNIGTATKKITIGLKDMIGLTGAAFTVDAVIEYGKELFKLGVEMESLGKKAQTVFAEELPAITAAAEENAAAIGLTISGYVDAATAIGDLLIPMGFQRSEAAAISTNLVNLSGALSEWTGGQRTATEVTQILSKAMLGEREELKGLGISISEADVKARLAEKGLENLTGQMLQQAKAAATLELVTEKSADAQAAFAKNTDSLVRKQAELTAKFQNIKEQLAEVLIPVFHRLVGVVDTLVSTFSSFIKLPTTDKLEDERKELGLLVNKITDTNTQQKERNALISTLQTRYPGFLGNLSAEKVTNEELGKRLSEVNDQYILKIALSKEDNKIQEQAEKVAGSQRKLAERRLNTEKKIFELNEKFKLNLDFTNKSYEERVRLTKEALTVKANEAETDLAGMKIARNIADLVVNGEAAAKRQLGTREKELELLKQQREEIKKNITAQLGITEDVDKPSGFTDKAEEARKAAELQAKLLVEENRAAAKKASEEASEQRAKDAEKEAVQLQKRLKRLQGIRDKFAEEATLKALSEEDRKIAELVAKYDKQIEEAKALETKKVEGAKEARLALERAKDLAVSELRQELFEKELGEESLRNAERTAAELEAINERELAKREAEDTINAEIREVLFSERELALLELEEHYAALNTLAEENGVDNLDILIAHRKEQARINAEFDKKDEEERVKVLVKHGKLLAKSFKDTESEIKKAQKSLQEAGIESVALSKALTLTQLGFDTASAISSLTKHSEANPANAVSFGAAGIAQFAAGLIRIFANIAQAKKLLFSAPQKKLGGYHQIKGQDDGITYNAKYIGSPQSGMLPAQSVVLASEGGKPEYFVSNPDLQNPVIANYVRIIDNISKGRTPSTPQFTEGGFSDNPINLPAPSSSQTTGTNEALLVEVARLNNLLERGIFSIIDDDTIVDIFKKFSELDEVARGELA